MSTCKKEGKLTVTEYEKGIVLPQKEVTDGPKWGLGGVCDSNNHFVGSSFYDGGWATHGGFYQWEQEEYIDADVVYVGMFYLHWGHFLMDLTGRMWFLQQLAKVRTDFKVAYLGEEEPKGNNLRFFELLGIKEEQLLHITKPTRFRRVYVPEQSFKSCEWYTDEFVQMFDEMYDMVMKSQVDFSKLQDIDKVYFTRRKFAKAVCSEFGEEYFEKCFTENGYTAIAPETLRLEEQFYLWNHAKEIVCMNGTIPLNVLFSQNKDLKLTILNKTSIPHENPFVLLEMRGIEAVFLDIYMEPFKNYPKSLGEGPFLLWPSEEFEVHCQKESFVLTDDTNYRNSFFRKQKIKYCWAILAFKHRLRILVGRLIPKTLKAIGREICRK